MLAAPAREPVTHFESALKEDGRQNIIFLRKKYPNVLKQQINYLDQDILAFDKRF
jgi:hypothetical protein